MKKEMKSTRAGFGDGLLDVAEKIPEVVTVDADLQHSVQTLKFAEKYPDRAINVGIAEQNMIGVAAGLARAGKIPFAATFAAFASGLVYNQIRQSIAYSKLPVCIVGTHAGILTGEDGATHQALEDLGLMRGLPGMTVLSPADYFEARALVPLIAKSKKPTYLRLGRQNIPTVYDAKFRPKIGKIDVLRRGKKTAIFATGTTVPFTLAAAENLDATVISVTSLKPFDAAGVLAVAKKFKKVFTVEDHSIVGGLGSAIAEVLAESGTATKLVRHGTPDVFGESGTSEDLLKKFHLDSKGIENKIAREIKK